MSSIVTTHYLSLIDPRKGHLEDDGSNSIFAHRLSMKTTTDDLESVVIDAAMQNPDKGSSWLAKYLCEKSVQLTAWSVTKILVGVGLESVQKRWLFLEKLALDDTVKLSSSQRNFIGRCNPAYHERHSINMEVGYLVYQNSLVVLRSKRHKGVCLNYVLDCASGYVFASTSEEMRVLDQIGILQKSVLPFFMRYKSRILQIMTWNDWLYTGGDNHGYACFLNKNDIIHLVESRLSGRVNGFNQKFLNALNSKIIKSYLSAYGNTLQYFDSYLQKSIASYNKQPLSGYPNFGQSPSRTLRHLISGQSSDERRVLRIHAHRDRRIHGL